MKMNRLTLTRHCTFSVQRWQRPPVWAVSAIFLVSFEFLLWRKAVLFWCDGGRLFGLLDVLMTKSAGRRRRRNNAAKEWEQLDVKKRQRRSVEISPLNKKMVNYRVLSETATVQGRLLSLTSSIVDTH